MAVRLFKLRGVPDDEADDVRLLLSEHEIAFYETHGGNWGIGTPAIWLRDEMQLEQAKALIDDYQQQRSSEKRAEYEAMKAEGLQPTFMDRFKQHPVGMTLFLLIALFILYVSLSPFLNFGH